MSILSDELSKPQYAGLTDQAAADAINAKTVVVQQSVSIRDLKTYAIFQGVWPKLLAGEKSSNLQVAGLCQSVVAWVDDPRISTVDVNIPEVQAMLTQLVSATIITQQQASEIVAMGSKPIAWTASVGLPEVGIGLVINARKEIAGVNN
jgi:hypothetical protein